MSDRDVATLREAAEVLRRRAPQRRFPVRLVVELLNNVADWIEKQDEHSVDG